LKKQPDKVLLKARELITGDRFEHYGRFSDNVEAMQLLMEGMTGRKFSKHEIHSFFIALKLARNHAGKWWNTDELVDLCGYLSLIDEIQERGKELEK